MKGISKSKKLKKSACWGALDFLRRVTQLGGLVGMLGLDAVQSQKYLSFAEGDHEIFFLGFQIWWCDSKIRGLYCFIFGHSLIEFHEYAACVSVFGSWLSHAWRTTSEQRWVHQECNVVSLHLRQQNGSHLLRFYPPSRCAWTVARSQKAWRFIWWPTANLMVRKNLMDSRSSSERCGGRASVTIRYANFGYFGAVEVIFKKHSQHLICSTTYFWMEIQISKDFWRWHTVDGRNPAPPGIYKTL